MNVGVIASRRLAIFACISVLMSGMSTNASGVFNWPSSPGWTAGAPGQGQTVTQSFTSVNPNDITVALYNSGVNLQGTYPAIDSTTETGGFTNVNGLQLYLSSTPQFGNYLRTTISFATPVANLSFQIWDVDASTGQFVDKIANLQGLSQDGVTLVGASSVTSEVAGYNTISGTGLSTVVLGTNPAANNTNQGTIDVTFTAPITQFSFEWSNNDNGRGAQAIAIGPLTYNIVPESDPLLSTVACSLTAILLEKVRRRRSQS